MSEEKRGLFVGIDLPKPRWHVTVKDRDVELFGEQRHRASEGAACQRPKAER